MSCMSGYFMSLLVVYNFRYMHRQALEQLPSLESVASYCHCRSLALQLLIQLNAGARDVDEMEERLNWCIDQRHDAHSSFGSLSHMSFILPAITCVLLRCHESRSITCKSGVTKSTGSDMTNEKPNVFCLVDKLYECLAEAASRLQLLVTGDLGSIWLRQLDSLLVEVELVARTLILCIQVCEGSESGAKRLPVLSCLMQSLNTAYFEAVCGLLMRLAGNDMHAATCRHIIDIALNREQCRTYINEIETGLGDLLLEGSWMEKIPEWAENTMNLVCDQESTDWNSVAICLMMVGSLPTIPCAASSSLVPCQRAMRSVLRLITLLLVPRVRGPESCSFLRGVNPRSASTISFCKVLCAVSSSPVVPAYLEFEFDDLFKVGQYHLSVWQRQNSMFTRQRYSAKKIQELQTALDWSLKSEHSAFHAATVLLRAGVNCLSECVCVKEILMREPKLFQVLFEACCHSSVAQASQKLLQSVLEPSNNFVKRDGGPIEIQDTKLTIKDAQTLSVSEESGTNGIDASCLKMLLKVLTADCQNTSRLVWQMLLCKSNNNDVRQDAVQLWGRILEPVCQANESGPPDEVHSMQASTSFHFA